MSQPSERNVVTVEIAGEEYAIRAQASPEYTRECAAYVDRTLAEIMRQGSLVQAHKGAILAALALADELFQTRAELESLRAEVTRRADGLVGEIEDRLGPRGLAGRL
ncbi:MAG TPA: cell division protein ZapA [Longimicrobiales bacterium]|nr:cell division protein ZapA [Longimicrobiales bacterium]